MPKKRQTIERIVLQYKTVLKNLGINAKKIILYGSYAAGTQRADSDIDLIVISDDFKKYNIRERLELLGLAAGKVFEPIEALGYTSKEMTKEKKEHSYVGEIQNQPIMEF